MCVWGRSKVIAVEDAFNAVSIGGTVRRTAADADKFDTEMDALSDRYLKSRGMRVVVVAVAVYACV